MAMILAVRVTPRSAKPGVGGWRQGIDGRRELEIRVAEAPADGEANAAVVRLLSKVLSVPKSAIEIVAGHAGRHKRVSLPLDDAEVRKRIQ